MADEEKLAMPPPAEIPHLRRNVKMVKQVVPTEGN